MNLFGRDLSKEVAVVAECGVNHEGDLQAALDLITAAAEAGADATKFQTYTPERLAGTLDFERLERVRRFQLDDDAHRELARHASACGIAFFSTPASEDVVPILDELCSVFKIASGDIDFEPVIRATAATGKPLIISTGTATTENISQAIHWVRNETRCDDLSGRVALLHCVSAYPTPIEQANLRAIPFLRERFGLVTGYSNHVVGTDACLGAVALGARIIEVHFTDQKEGRTFRDHALSMDATDLRAFVRSARAINSALGVYDKPVQACEQAAVDLIRKGVVAARDLEPGTVLTQQDLMFARPATGFPAREIESLIGRTLGELLRLGEPFKPEMLR